MPLTENRRIFWNVVFTYGRFLLSIAGGLFISRWVLMALGQVNYGLFSVIGGMVVFIQFFNNILASATARFYAFSIGENQAKQSIHSLEECRKWFNTSLTIHTLLPCCLIMIGYPTAKWAILHWLTIPPDRIQTCVWVLRFTCFSAFVTMINIPFSAMYTAKQYIVELTIYSMATTILNVIFAYFMVSHPGEWLTKYALWMCMMSVAPQLIICVRANRIFEECKIVWAYLGNKAYLKRLAEYAYWQFFGSFCWLLRGQGIVLLINKMLGPVVNASMQIANQVSAASATLSSSLISGFSPAIMTAYGAKDYKRMTTLAFESCKFGTLLALIFVIPLACELPQVISIWLKNPPQFTVGLCYFMFACYICDVCTTGDMIMINASGKIKHYQLAASIIFLFVLPAGILALYLGGNVYHIGVILLVSTILNSAVRVYFAQRLLNMSAVGWIKEVMCPLLALTVITGLLSLIPHLFMPRSIIRLLIVGIWTEVVFFSLTWLIGLNTQERNFISAKLKGLYKRFLAEKCDLFYRKK